MQLPGEKGKRKRDMPFSFSEVAEKKKKFIGNFIANAPRSSEQSGRIDRRKVIAPTKTLRNNGKGGMCSRQGLCAGQGARRKSSKPTQILLGTR